MQLGGCNGLRTARNVDVFFADNDQVNQKLADTKFEELAQENEWIDDDVFCWAEVSIE